MMKKYIYLIGMAALLSGCSNELAAPETDSGFLPITFTANGIEVSAETQAQTRAAKDFPNGKSIAILAAKSNSATAPTNWESNNLYASLLHAPATAGTGTENEAAAGTGTKIITYPVNLSATAYWPFSSDEYLGFTAYSPATHATLSHTGNDKTVSISSVNAANAFPDLLYTLPTSTAYNKQSGKDGVDLGTFRHAMAQLVIKVIPVDETGKPIGNYSNANLKITKLAIQTKVTEGTFDLSSSQWTLTEPAMSATYTTIYTLIDNTTAKSLPYESDNVDAGESITQYYLFPETAVKTASLSKIMFKLEDGNINVGSDDGYLINGFTYEAVAGNALEMGKTTTLTFKVKVTDIETGNTDATILEGTLTDWIDKGNHEVTIQ